MRQQGYRLIAMRENLEGQHECFYVIGWEFDALSARWYPVVVAVMKPERGAFVSTEPLKYDAT